MKAVVAQTAAITAMVALTQVTPNSLNPACPVRSPRAVEVDRVIPRDGA